VNKTIYYRVFKIIYLSIVHQLADVIKLCCHSLSFALHHLIVKILMTTNDYQCRKTRNLWFLCFSSILEKLRKL